MEGGLLADGVGGFPSQGFGSEDFDLTHPYPIQQRLACASQFYDLNPRVHFSTFCFWYGSYFPSSRALSAIRSSLSCLFILFSKTRSSMWKKLIVPT